MIYYLFHQYSNYTTIAIFLEITAVVFGLLSVWFAKKDNILVFPTGIISTFIYVYLLWKWELLGDMMINAYYLLMSVYGWFLWTRKRNNKTVNPITKMTKKEVVKAFVIFVLTLLFVVFIYIYFNKFTTLTSYLDTFVTGLFFVGMWLMAKRNIENWVLWIIGDLFSIPMYFVKGYTFTSLQYVLFTIIAFYGYKEWKNILNNNLHQF